MWDSKQQFLIPINTCQLKIPNILATLFLVAISLLKSNSGDTLCGSYWSITAGLDRLGSLLPDLTV